MMQLTIDEQIKAAEYSWQNRIREAAEKFKVLIRTLKKYRANHAKLVQSENSKAKKVVKKLPDEKEQALLKFIEQQRARHFGVTGTSLTSNSPS
jgi:hypothetical protein